MASAKVQEQPRPAAFLMKPVELVQVIIAGAVVGLVALAIYSLLDVYVFTPILCNDSGALAGRCISKTGIVDSLAMVFAATAGLFALVRLRVYRPLLVVILVSVTAWGALPMLRSEGMNLTIWGIGLAAALLFGLMYGLFAWLVQIRNFIVGLLVSIVVLIAVRLLLVS